MTPMMTSSVYKPPSWPCVHEANSGRPKLFEMFVISEAIAKLVRVFELLNKPDRSTSLTNLQAASYIHVRSSQTFKPFEPHVSSWWFKVAETNPRHY